MSDDLLKIIVDDTGDKMTDAVAHSRREFATVRTGRASSSLVERLIVQAYGVDMKMQELASFSVPEARQLLITPHDPANVPAIERAINQSDLGLTPSSDGRTIRLAFPPFPVPLLVPEGRSATKGLQGGEVGRRPALPGSLSPICACLVLCSLGRHLSVIHLGWQHLFRSCWKGQ